MTTKRVINTENAPSAIGPYSQAIKAGGWIYTAGVIPLDPATGQMVEGDIQVKAHRVLDSLKAIIESAGASMSDVVKTTIFLKDLKDFVAVNEVYSQYFSAPFPARSTVQVAMLPKDAEVEIEAIVYHPE